ncbi:MAG: L,D-transpeptidase family protein [Patescibacteria group bacterium]
MINKIFKTPIPSWVLLLFVALVIIGLGIFINHYSTKAQNYDLFITDSEGKSHKFEYGVWPALENAEFFGAVKKKLISDRVDFVESDLSAMKLRVYKLGVMALEVNILSKGKEGSWWETPAGIYRIQSKEKSHFSSFGGVYMPWSMAFQGNFFIHGWPYYPGGEPVAKGYSGGCIRLSSDDAKAVFDLVEIGTPVLVFEQDFSSDNFKYNFKIPEISAKAYLAADLRNNFVFLEKSTKEQLPVASLTKLVTAAVATEYINLEKEITVDKNMIATTSLPRLKIGQRISAFNLLYPLLMESSNEAALAISGFMGKDRFVELMNEKARALGMENTAFIDPAGRNAGNVSTPEDLFNFAKYLYNNRRFILKTSAGKLDWSIYGSSIFPDLKNFNVFANDPDFVGGKVGETIEAKQTILSIFELDLGGEKRPIAIIVLGSDDNTKDAREILGYIKGNY